ncbi:MAG: hypothetical protein WC384_13305 [Prolixibacteraceae bacterium]|jgi:hypothetical protein
MEPEVSTKNTKNEILAAYDELMKKVQEKKTDEPKKVQEQQKQETVVKNAAALSNEGIVKEISGLKVGLSSALDKLSENFVAEFRKFEELQQAIKIEKQQLEDLYQLSANTDSLAAMLLAQKEKKEQFEQEMASRKAEFEEKIRTEKEKVDLEMSDKRLLWKKEQELYAAQTKEALDEKKKSQAREDEEYHYNLKITRKKEIDQYEEKKQKLEKELADKKAAFEKEFAERETKIQEAEAELKDLRIKNAAFPAELEKAVTAATKSVSERLETQFGFEKELKEKETVGELKLKDQIIGTLNAKIKDMEITIKELSQKAITAETSVKDIAIRAIESSSKPYFIEKNKEGQGKE